MRNGNGYVQSWLVKDGLMDRPAAVAEKREDVTSGRGGEDVPEGVTIGHDNVSRREYI
jgi:hypothetical protein